MEQLSALTTEELIARKKKLKGILIGFMVIAGMLVLVYAYRYFVISKPMSVGTFVPLMVLPITWLPMITSLRSLSAEINSRKKAI
ncbi:hypothetical protein LJ707_07660 [Mucilaginibacter sp. UR6-1]|uniref:hypothetical protein n=1 Tax=Mucilaginibacter sp. UR6-1 TaxID=1435643 RepID=UPI001E338488|nr:hypothetical protein [Mucilaginibacter sp. UR6-1]MCC8408801.1 hypothetical protein [Mucilaginibacter sp. UR6-1]